MPAVHVPKPGVDFALGERDMPEPGLAQVRIRVHACGICHSDGVTKDGLFPSLSHIPTKIAETAVCIGWGEDARLHGRFHRILWWITSALSSLKSRVAVEISSSKTRVLVYCYPKIKD